MYRFSWKKKHCIWVSGNHACLTKRVWFCLPKQNAYAALALIHAGKICGLVTCGGLVMCGRRTSICGRVAQVWRLARHA